MLKKIILAVSLLVAGATSAQESNSVVTLQAIQETCSQLLNLPEYTASLRRLPTLAKAVKDSGLQADVLATYAMGMFCCDQDRVANKVVQYLQQAFPTSPRLALFQGSQYQTDCPRCSGNGIVEMPCSQCGGKGSCKGCLGRGTITRLNKNIDRCVVCRGTGQCPACKGSLRETSNCPQCFGRRRFTSKELMRGAYLNLIQQTKTLAFEQERVAIGLILFEGQWVTPADKKTELDKRDALAKARQAEDKLLAEEEARKLIAEEKARKLIEEKRRQAAEHEAVLRKQLPAYTGGESEGRMIVRIRNPNDFAVAVGLRSGDKGRDFDVLSNGVNEVHVPNGKYDIYFVYSNQPTSLFQGDSFTIDGNGVEIEIVKVVDGNYGIRQVK